MAIVPRHLSVPALIVDEVSGSLLSSGLVRRQQVSVSLSLTAPAL